MKSKEGIMVETESTEISEAVWQAWIEKNKAQDIFRFNRRLRVIGLMAVLVPAALLLWKLAS